MCLLVSSLVDCRSLHDLCVCVEKNKCCFPMSNQSMSTFWGESVSIPAGEYTSGWERYSKASSEREDMHDFGFAKTNC